MRPPIIGGVFLINGNIGGRLMLPMMLTKVFAGKNRAKTCFVCFSNGKEVEESALAKKAMSVRDAEQIAKKIAEEQNVELVDVELVKEPTGYFLRFYIERAEGDGIALNELEAFHRKIQPLVETVEYDYMEVSSPGADRPLKHDRDFERAAGLDVELKTYRPVNGAKVFRGELIGLVDGKIEINAESGEKLSFEKKEVAIVRPIIEFNEEDLQDDAPAARN